MERGKKKVGTSKGYISPTNIPWRQAKRAVTSFARDSGSDFKLQRAVGNYAAAKVSDASNYQAAVKSISRVAKVIGSAGSGGLGNYLHEIHRDDLIGKSAEELMTALLYDEMNNGSSAEEQLLIDTIPQVLENLEIVTQEDLRSITPASFMVEFLGEFICNDFDRCFDEQIRRHISPREYDQVIGRIHGYIKNTIYELKDSLAGAVTSFDKLESNTIVTNCLNDAFQIFKTLYVKGE